MSDYLTMRSGWIAAIGCVIFAMTAAGQELGGSSNPVIGRQIELLGGEFVGDRTIAWAEIEPDRLVVVAFLGTECPLARKYVRRLNELAAAMPQVQWLGVFSNEQDTAGEVLTFVDEFDLTFPAIKDAGHLIADMFSAERTPEVFLLDAERRIRYRGRIDDQYGIGYSKASPMVHYLREAIDQVIAADVVKRPQTTAVGCVIGRVESGEGLAALTYAEDVAPILNQHCIGCHQAGQIGPMALSDPDDVKGWAKMINEVVQSGRMPPWHADPDVGEFANARRLSDQEKQTIAQWATSGAAIGDRSRIPDFAPRTNGWQFAELPDLVLPVSLKSVEVHPTGEMDYLYFKSDYVFEKERWVSAVQILPGNHAVVHHILAFIESPNGRQVVGDLEGIDGYLAGYVPGLTVFPYPAGTAKRIPANSRLIFQVHYTPIGSPQTDHSQIGIYFADPKSVEREVVTTSAIRRKLEIPPENSDYQVASYSHRSLANAQLLGMMPHMHLRGKSFRYELQRSDGAIAPLLNVPRYDFHWQSSYRLARPLELRDGDRIACVAQFDNSAGNPNNPDPTQTVRWGDQTREEMMIGYFDIAIPREDYSADGVDLERHVKLVRIMDRFDTNRNGIVARSEISEAVSERFGELDGNADDLVTFAELAAGWDRPRNPGAEGD
jgi:mono/diheme cytochrome c family protein